MGSLYAASRRASKLLLPHAAAALCQRGLSSTTWAAAAHGGLEAVQEDQFYTEGKLPSSFLGPLALRTIPGKGRGLVATQDVPVGGLLLVDSPLAILHGPVDEMPDVDALTNRLERELKTSPHLGAALRGLWDGRRREPSPPSGSSSSTEGLDVEAVVALNAFGDGYEDLAACQLREAEARSHVGVWPTFALLNHSCLPNCIHYVVGSSMVVRACRHIAAGTEATISYLGREEFAPAVLRQEVLSKRYGFTCACPRCTLESQLLSPGTAMQLQHVHARARHTLLPQMSKAAADDDAVAVATAASELHQLQQQLLPVFSEALETAHSLPPELLLPLSDPPADGPSPVPASGLGSGGPSGSDLMGEAQRDDLAQCAVLCLMASCMDVFEMAYVVASARGAGDAGSEQLRHCARITDLVSRGSELHVFQTAASLGAAIRAQREVAGAGRGGVRRDRGAASEGAEAGSGARGSRAEAAALAASEEVQATAAECQAAHRARYGNRLGPGTIRKLVQANLKLSSQYL